MPSDDRDRNLDKALQRHFRPSPGAKPLADAPLGAMPASASLAAAAFKSAPTASTACPDAEILAAYHDGGLSPEELAHWKSHVLSCADCQLVLEHLATPLDAPVAVDTPAHILLPAQVKERPTAVAAVAARASGSNAQFASRAVAPATIAMARPRKTYFRWLVPTGAIAAGLLAWVVIRESGIPTLAPKMESVAVQSAENRQAPSAPAAAPVPSTVASSAAPESKRVAPPPAGADQQLSAQLDQRKLGLAKQAEEKNKDQQPPGALVGGIAGSLAKEKTRDDEQQLRRLQSAPQSAYNYAASPSHGPRLTQQQQQAQLNSRAAENSDFAAADKKNLRAAPALVEPGPPRDEPSFVEPGLVNPQAAAKVAQPAPGPPPPPPAPALSAGSASGAAVAAPRSQAAARARADDATSALTQTVVVESDAASNVVRTASAAMRGPQVFNDPTHKALWRVGSAGSLEFSGDSGVTWISQSSGITADLFTGSAPAAKVCWVVGASGAMLRTTDRGKHWIKLNAPVAADILGIHATDAFHATIWFVPDPQSGAVATYKTSDGALTWSLVPSN